MLPYLVAAIIVIGIADALRTSAMSR